MASGRMFGPEDVFVLLFFLPFFFFFKDVFFILVFHRPPFSPRLLPSTPPLHVSPSCYISDSCDLAKKSIPAISTFSKLLMCWLQVTQYKQVERHKVLPVLGLERPWPGGSVGHTC